MSTEIRNPVVTSPVHLASSANQKEPAARPNQSRRSIARTMLAPIVPRDWKKVPILALISLMLHLTVLGAIGLMVFNTEQLIGDFFTTVTDSEEFSDPIVEHSLFPDDHKSETTLDDPLAQSASSELQDGLKGPINVNFGEGELKVESLSTGLPGIAEINVGNETSGRMSAQAKREMVERYGGTTATEAAVVAGLQWLAKHQNPDGSWDFEHSNCPTCKGQCSQNGTLKNCRTGATGMALLSFLGAGHTHKAGDYTGEVRRGIEFLQKTGKQGKGNFDLRGNPFGREGMYAHGICAIALCECSAMTRDANVRKSATEAVNFIVTAQNKTTGGWRYKIGDPGDTSVVGWQVMALKSAQTARLDFPRKAFVGAEKYLNWAQRNRGSHYVYDPSRRDSGDSPNDESMTAVGLLCRMYLGWDRRHPQLETGVRYLSEIGPRTNDMYYNYYATQVLHHWGGDEWTKWNEVMREHLVRTQHPPRTGHMSGSWDVADHHGDAGGRLYMTCLCVMTLEVYYRHLPLYDRDNLKVNF